MVTLVTNTFSYNMVVFKCYTHIPVDGVSLFIEHKKNQILKVEHMVHMGYWKIISNLNSIFTDIFVQRKN